MTDQLAPTEQHAMSRASVRKLVQEEPTPRAREFDCTGRIDKTLFPKMSRSCS